MGKCASKGADNSLDVTDVLMRYSHAHGSLPKKGEKNVLITSALP
jgi:hypothetical protein